MQRTFVIAQKEFRHFIKSPLSYVLAGIFSILIGVLFFNLLLVGNQHTEISLGQLVLRPVFANINTLFIFMIPVLTMSLISEEKKLGTMDLLLGSPLKIWELLAGKYLACCFYVLMLLVLTLIYPTILWFSGHQFFTEIFVGYLGTFINALAYISVGLFASTLTKNQMMACILGFFLIFFVISFAWFGQSTDNFLLSQIFTYVSITSHFEPFGRGVIKSYDLVYYATFTLFFLGLSYKSLNARNW